MNRRRHHPRTARRGYILASVLIFLALAFAAWVLMFHSSATLIRVEQARMLEQSRATWTAPATAAGLRLLETGTPPLDDYQCKLTLTQNGQTRYFLLSYEKIADARWTLTCIPTVADNYAPDAPSTFAVPPDAPGGLTATATSSSGVNLAWTDVAHDTGYRIERSADGITGWTQIGSVARNITAFSDTGLSTNTTYYYRVYATGTAGSSDYSTVASATPH